MWIYLSPDIKCCDRMKSVIGPTNNHGAWLANSQDIVKYEDIKWPGEYSCYPTYRPFTQFGAFTIFFVGTDFAEFNYVVSFMNQNICLLNNSSLISSLASQQILLVYTNHCYQQANLFLSIFLFKKLKHGAKIICTDVRYIYM